MDDTELYKVLFSLIRAAGKAVWRLEGSANLRVQAVGIEPNDVDIETDDSGFEHFKNSLAQYFVKEFPYEEAKGRKAQYSFGKTELEVIARHDGLDMLDRISKVRWRGLELPVLQLPDAREFYEQIGRASKVEIIDSYLKNKAI